MTFLIKILGFYFCKMMGNSTLNETFRYKMPTDIRLISMKSSGMDQKLEHVEVEIGNFSVPNNLSS